jgi:hypothetical protein
LLADLRPDRGRAGEKVVIKGRGFDPEATDNEVYFDKQPALILAATETELTVIAPPAVAPGAQVTSQVRVKANGAVSSSPAPFLHQRPSASTFVPHFFAAAVLGYPYLAFVSTDLGPVLLLGGYEGEVTATAARALHVAAALNALVDEAPSKAPTFEVQDKPETAITVAGGPGSIVSVTAEDAAAYELPLEPGVKNRRPSVRGLAAYWAALLQDYFNVFLLKQRPVNVLALSPRGHVLADIHANAQRTPGAVGVPSAHVVPTSPALAKALREVALLVPAEKEAQVNVAVEGRWEGSVEETGVGQKAIQVRLQSAAGKLQGTLSARSGKIEANAPLRDVTYQRGQLRFTVDFQGGATTFLGTVQGGSITGTIQRTTDKASGRFSLRYVE